jgi:uncharacterized YigZ family protein
MGKAADEKHDPDAYATIAGGCEHETRILASRFIACARGTDSVDAAMAFLETLRRRHHAATHHCYAYRIGGTEPQTRSNDDGEPSGTAGRRILMAIEEAGLTDCVVVVVRYFGGTKLGAGGLSHAYHDAAAAVLTRAVVEHRYVTARFTVAFPYNDTRQVHHALERSEAEILDRRFGDDTAYVIGVRRSRAAALREALLTLTERRARIEDGTATSP